MLSHRVFLAGLSVLCFQKKDTRGEVSVARLVLAVKFSQISLEIGLLTLSTHLSAIHAAYVHQPQALVAFNSVLCARVAAVAVLLLGDLF